MLLAVNMPEQEPHVGHAERSIFSSSSSLTFESLDAIIESIKSNLTNPNADHRELHQAFIDLAAAQCAEIEIPRMVEEMKPAK